MNDPLPHGPCTKVETWWWLENNERTVLEDLNPDARPIINKSFNHTTLLHRQHHVLPSSGKPWLPAKSIVVHDRVRRMVEVHHPLNPDYTKHEYRWCVEYDARSPYGLGGKWEEMVHTVMHPELLKRLDWRIYAPSYGEGLQDFYLYCDLKGPGNAQKVALYVPTLYFRLKDWSIVEKRHLDLAVGYYKGTGFSQPEEILKKWQDQTAAALACLEARVLRAIVEGK